MDSPDVLRELRKKMECLKLASPMRIVQEDSDDNKENILAGKDNTKVAPQVANSCTPSAEFLFPRDKNTTVTVQSDCDKTNIGKVYTHDKLEICYKGSPTVSEKSLPASDSSVSSYEETSDQFLNHSRNFERTVLDSEEHSSVPLTGIFHEQEGLFFTAEELKDIHPTSDQQNCDNRPDSLYSECTDFVDVILEGDKVGVLNTTFPVEESHETFHESLGDENGIESVIVNISNAPIEDVIVIVDEDKCKYLESDSGIYDKTYIHDEKPTINSTDDHESNELTTENPLNITESIGEKKVEAVILNEFPEQVNSSSDVSIKEQIVEVKVPELQTCPDVIIIDDSFETSKTDSNRETVVDNKQETEKIFEDLNCADSTSYELNDSNALNTKSEVNTEHSQNILNLSSEDLPEVKKSTSCNQSCESVSENKSLDEHASLEEVKNNNSTLSEPTQYQEESEIPLKDSEQVNSAANTTFTCLNENKTQTGDQKLSSSEYDNGSQSLIPQESVKDCSELISDTVTEIVSSTFDSKVEDHIPDSIEKKSNFLNTSAENSSFEDINNSTAILVSDSSEKSLDISSNSLDCSKKLSPSPKSSTLEDSSIHGNLPDSSNKKNEYPKDCGCDKQIPVEEIVERSCEIVENSIAEDDVPVINKSSSAFIVLSSPTKFTEVVTETKRDCLSTSPCLNGDQENLDHSLQTENKFERNNSPRVSTSGVSEICNIQEGDSSVEHSGTLNLQKLDEEHTSKADFVGKNSNIPDKLLDLKKMADVNEKLQQENSDLKLELNAAKQAKATLELEMGKKDEVILKTQAEAIRKEQQYLQDIKALKEQLKERTSQNEKDSVKELEEALKEAKAKESQALSELNARINDELNYRKIMEEYEKTIAARIADSQKLKEENETVTRHLANLELSFSDLHQKYERTKTIIVGFKSNEDKLRKKSEILEEMIHKQEEKYESLKAHAKAQIEKSNKEIMQRTEKYESEVTKLNAIIKRWEIKSAAFETSLEQKTKECFALAALCDEVTGKKV